MLKKIGNIAKAAWKYLYGKKRRIAVVAALASKYVPEPYNDILTVVSALLGGMDLAHAAKRKIESRKKLPGGIGEN